ncbi:uncharacterized protein L969DRAFT_55174 [Mixia osmundae IAM 14324]|uniref:OPA3-like protein n=1 Tax=Mixia osmundae (strain CBS 9802 / IAM 14324 / JCM 22182 / KY 12970) TaxID=764103 RepID=G7DV57_MIXOS|nr:uncharacterized protein L969DRAFT_55174 [Mixia osmundae IAM 14324]KEI36316.1 hypothetical protein L969DRAFT_55174 [Mixia osmundae IAM 14324]GAA94467.1 hypothetical protein E5Q_01119 [Mixia osmundae IAM 14324]
MASVKIASLAIRTLAKPISAKLKSQAQEHPRFRAVCIDIAQFMHRTEFKMRTNLLGEPVTKIRPLNDAKAISQGANFLSESFLFSVALALIVGENVRGRVKTARRKDEVDDKLDAIHEEMRTLKEAIEKQQARLAEALDEEKARVLDFGQVLETIVDSGVRGEWLERIIAGDGPTRSALERLRNETKPMTKSENES